jgi:uncharacterized protein YbaR (Trm112 family)
MKRSFFEKLCCPFDKKDLQLQVFSKELDDNIKEGLLTCSTCKRYFPIVYGIPIMTPDEFREKALEEPIMARWLPAYKTADFTLDTGDPDV